MLHLNQITFEHLKPEPGLEAAQTSEAQKLSIDSTSSTHPLKRRLQRTGLLHGCEIEDQNIVA
jgi:hypothetical protein